MTLTTDKDNHEKMQRSCYFCKCLKNIISTRCNRKNFSCFKVCETNDIGERNNLPKLHMLSTLKKKKKKKKKTYKRWSKQDLPYSDLFRSFFCWIYSDTINRIFFSITLQFQPKIKAYIIQKEIKCK